MATGSPRPPYETLRTTSGSGSGKSGKSGFSGNFFSLFSLLWTSWDLRVTPPMDRNHIISIMYPWGRSEHRRAEGPWVRVQFKIDFNHGGVLMTVAAFVVAHLMTILLDSKVWKKIGKSVCKRRHTATSMYRWHEF